MTRWFKLLFITGCIALSLSPLTAFAQSTPTQTAAPAPTTQTIQVGAYSCKRIVGQERNGDANTAQKLVDNYLLNLFTYSSLRDRLRCDPLIVGVLNSNGQPITTSVYKVCQNLVNFSVLLVLLAIAFANILRFKLDTYAVKKAVPLLIFGVIMSNLGLPIIRTVVDFSGVLTASVIGDTTDSGTKEAFAQKTISAVYIGGAEAVNDTLKRADSGTTPWGSFFSIFGFAAFAFAAPGPFFAAVFMVFFLIFIPAIMFLYLGLLFVARIYVIVILAAVSPVAFASLGFEPLRGRLWGWWWGQFIKWTFMAPATFFLLWLGVQFFNAAGGQMDIGTYVLTLAIIVAATRIPVSWGGSIMAQWNSRIAAPVRDALMSPFRAAQQYVGSKTKVDATRFLNARGLNFVRVGKDVAAEFERRAAERDTTSASVELGRRLSRIQFERTGRGGLRGLLTNPGLRTTGRYERAEDFEVANQYTDRIMNNISSPDNLDAAEIQQLRNETQNAVQGGDTNRIIGAYFANARAGDYMSDDEQEALLRRLEQQGVNRDTIARRYNRIIAERKGYRAATPQPGRDREETKTEYLNYLYSQLRTKSDHDLQRTIFPDMIQRLREPGGTNLRSIGEIESNSTLFGIANALIRNQHRLTPDQLSALSPLFTDQERLGTSTVSAVAGTVAPNLVTTPGTHDHLDPLMVPGRITDRSWSGLTDAERQAIQESLVHRRGPMKGMLADYASTLSTRLRGVFRDPTQSAQQTVNLESLLHNHLDQAHPDSTPQTVSRQDILRAIDTDGTIDQDDEQAASELVNELRTLNAIYGNIQEFDNLRSSGRIP